MSLIYRNIFIYIVIDPEREVQKRGQVKGKEPNNNIFQKRMRVKVRKEKGILSEKTVGKI